jgi:hypothetical protein
MSSRDICLKIFIIAHTYLPLIHKQKLLKNKEKYKQHLNKHTLSLRNLTDSNGLLICYLLISCKNTK